MLKAAVTTYCQLNQRLPLNKQFFIRTTFGKETKSRLNWREALNPLCFGSSLFLHYDILQTCIWLLIMFFESYVANYGWLTQTSRLLFVESNLSRAISVSLSAFLHWRRFKKDLLSFVQIPEPLALHQCLTWQFVVTKTRLFSLSWAHVSCVRIYGWFSSISQGYAVRQWHFSTEENESPSNRLQLNVTF